jgi:protein-disulfide isomerase
MGQRTRLDQITSIVVMLSAVVVAVTVGFRALRSQPLPAPQALAAVSQIGDSSWEEALDLGIAVGGAIQPRVTIVELTDLECPACRAFQSTLDGLLSERGQDIRLLYIPYPLPYHRFAIAAANAAECAAETGTLPQWIHAIYQKQDSLGLKTWANYASDAGIADTANIAQCAKVSEPSARVQSGLALGARIGATGTPTVILNGLHYRDTPTREQLEHAIDSVLKSNLAISAQHLLMMGKVLDSASNAPVQGALVDLINASGVAEIRDTSEAAGDFTLQGKDGRYHLSVKRTGYRSFMGSLRDLRGEQPPNVIFLARTGDPSTQ